jgi:uncharacterized protein YydD (DUF2326 family)
MIHKIFSSLPTFKTLEFTPGLNIILAKKEEGASNKQTRNRAGKTSLIEVVHFLTGADAGPDSIFRKEEIISQNFGITFDLAGRGTTVCRSGITKSKVELSVENNGRDTLSNGDWVEILGEKMFRLNIEEEAYKRKPTFRSLFSYFVRRQMSNGFTSPEKQSVMQKTGDFQISLMYLLDLDWYIASDWQIVREREKSLEELKKAAASGTFGKIIGKAADLRTQLSVAEANMASLNEQITSFKVLPEYRVLEKEANEITQIISELGNGNTTDLAKIHSLEKAVNSEEAPPKEDLEAIYSEVGVILPSLAIKRYEEVQSFHESLIRNRKNYLLEELSAAKLRIEEREKEKYKLDQRRSEIMKILRSHGALDHFHKIQSEYIRTATQVESLRQQYESALQLEGTKNELEIERNKLNVRLRRDFSEQSKRVAEAINAFEETSKRLYESAGSMIIDDTSNGPMFKFPMQGASSKGIMNMQIFCFDLMLMQICSKRGIGPGFLIHDSHLFDGVDGRQLISAIKVGAEMAENIGYQYIITMNEDDLFKETIVDFDVSKYINPIQLTDATEDGGLFGIRF